MREHGAKPGWVVSCGSGPRELTLPARPRQGSNLDRAAPEIRGRLLKLGQTRRRRKHHNLYAPTILNLNAAHSSFEADNLFPT